MHPVRHPLPYGTLVYDRRARRLLLPRFLFIPVTLANARTLTARALRRAAQWLDVA
jgi:hypothetical protein